MEPEAGDTSAPAGGGFPRKSITALLQLYPGNWEPWNTIKSHLTTNLTRKIYYPGGWLPLLGQEAAGNQAAIRPYKGFLGSRAFLRWPGIGGIFVA